VPALTNRATTDVPHVIVRVRSVWSMRQKPVSQMYPDWRFQPLPKSVLTADIGVRLPSCSAK
jgi:hypothetical protein